MYRPIVLTRRDQWLMETLALKVRLASLRQLADFSWNGDVANARRRLEKLRTAGLLVRFTVAARDLPQLLKPICSWSPGLTIPEAGPISYQLCRRWEAKVLRQRTVYVASEHTSHLFGGPKRGRLSRATQASHDLSQFEVYFRLCQQNPVEAANWQSEDLRAKVVAGEKRPDALILDPMTGEPTKVIEIGGRYSVRHVRAFIRHCVSRKTAFEIW